MSHSFFEKPILNSPYEMPYRHWELDAQGQPTQHIIDGRREAKFITPIPKPRKQKGAPQQDSLVFDEGHGLSNQEQSYANTAVMVNALRTELQHWRALPKNAWRVTPETARLLQHWRQHPFSSVRPFFCQVEAVETVIWLLEVAPQLGKGAQKILDHLAAANQEAELMRLALKLATGAGKTTVMAMLIAWQTVNAVRHPQSKRFTRGFLLVTPGLTIKDRLRVLQPNDPDSYYKQRELVPSDMLPDLHKAKIVITNYHAFQRRERLPLSKGGRALLQGRGGEALDTLESEGQMLQRVMPSLMGLRQIMVMNDEAHHCYRAKPSALDDLTGEDKQEAEQNNQAARLWISGLEAVNRKLKVMQVLDLSATPFFLRGSGYAEGTLFPWTMSDFSLMDAIECGIVKLPRVPVADNIPNAEAPMFRDLWAHIGKDMPKKGRAKAGELDAARLPIPLQTALEALYGHYKQTFDLWQTAAMNVPPCFIVVCNNTAASKLVYDYIAGYQRADGQHVTGKFELFRNFDDHGHALGRPHTLLIDSQQLESGEALDEQFRTVASTEIEQLRRDIIARTGDVQAAQNISDQALLREVMNSVGKADRLGETIRCVVSVSMLTEGWDANTVTHVLGVRAFGTQLLCEQVIGRALRRQSYELNEDGLFNVEYADVLGIPFDFNAKPVIAPPQPPRETIRVHALPERTALTIEFPRVQGYRIEFPQERLRAEFTTDSHFELTPELIGATKTQNAGIIGQGITLNLGHTDAVRQAQIVYQLTAHLLNSHWRDDDGAPRLDLFGQLKRIVAQWLAEGHLLCKGDTYPAQLLFKPLADRACEKIHAGITRAFEGRQGNHPIKALLDPYNPSGSSAHVNFTTSKTERWQTDSRRCHLNWVILDSGWEAEFCRVLEQDARVLAYVKNHNLGFEVPYQLGGELHHYRPDFIVLVNDGKADPLRLVVEIKGRQGENSRVKKETMEVYWLPAVNRLGTFGRWAFAQFTDVFELGGDLSQQITQNWDEVMEEVVHEN